MIKEWEELNAKRLHPKTTEEHMDACDELRQLLFDNQYALLSLVKAAKSYANSTSCSDPDCYHTAIEHEANRQETLSALAKLEGK